MFGFSRKKKKSQNEVLDRQEDSNESKALSSENRTDSPEDKKGWLLPKVSVKDSIKKRLVNRPDIGTGRSISRLKGIFTQRKEIDEIYDEFQKVGYNFAFLLFSWSILTEKEAEEVIDNPDEKMPMVNRKIQESLNMLKELKLYSLIYLIILSLLLIVPHFFITINTIYHLPVFLISVAFLGALLIKHLSYHWRENILVNRRFLPFFTWLLGKKEA